MSGIEERAIGGIPIRIYGVAKTVVDVFRHSHRASRRYNKQTSLNHAIEGLREALRQHKATPAEIARYAAEAEVWNLIKPYLEALTADA